MPLLFKSLSHGVVLAAPLKHKFEVSQSERKTVKIRRGAAAVIGQVPEHSKATANVGRPFRIRYEP